MQKIFASSQIQSIMVESETVTGAAAVLQVAESYGVDACLPNPGTTEMHHFVGAFESVPKIKPILALHEA